MIYLYFFSHKRTYIILCVLNSLRTMRHNFAHWFFEYIRHSLEKHRFFLHSYWNLNSENLCNFFYLNIFIFLSHISTNIFLLKILSLIKIITYLLHATSKRNSEMLLTHFILAWFKSETYMVNIPAIFHPNALK